MAGKPPLPPFPDFKLGLYRHFRGETYRAFNLVRRESDLEPMVLYASAAEPSVVWVRPLKEWTEMVVNAGHNLVPRYKKEE